MSMNMIDAKQYPDVKPALLNLEIPADKKAYEILNLDLKTVKFDQILLQLADLIHVRNPSQTYSAEEMNEKILTHLGNTSLEDYGIWVYYPWSCRLVHLLPEHEFIEVRTNRNVHKITCLERAVLASKRVGVIGLSVGQSVAITMAMERVAGELVIADFDTLELSNLNRIRSGVHNIGLSKVAMVAREITEIDPFLKVTCYFEGITTNNLTSFMTVPKPLDLLVEECDSLNIKVESRRTARALGIPVVMDTSDKGMLDIENFKEEPERKLFHGLLGDLEDANFDNLTAEQRLYVLTKVVGADSISARLKASVLEMNFSIRSWPQLASAVALGGAIVTDTVRRIFLNEPVMSGRYYIDVAEKILRKDPKKNSNNEINNCWDAITKTANNYILNSPTPSYIPDSKVIERLVKAACAAPSSGNNQPWKWWFKNGKLLLFIDTIHTQSFGDFLQIPTYISLGAALENLTIAAEAEGLVAIIQQANLDDTNEPIASITFSQNHNENRSSQKLSNFMFERKTNRKHYSLTPISENIKEEIYNIVNEFGHSNASIQIESNPTQLSKLGAIVAEMDMMKLLNKHGHKDFFNNELRWSTEHALALGDGIDLPSLQLSNSEKMELQLLSDPDIATLLASIDGGKRLLENTKRMLANTPTVAFLTLPAFNNFNFVEGGKLMQKILLYCTSQSIAVQPVVSPLYFTYRYLHGKSEGLSKKEGDKIALLREEFLKIFKSDNNTAEILLFRMGYADALSTTSIRRKMEDVLQLNIK